ncbi:sugar ABC transporter ATP-binding protein [uncultured Microbacterium sp.]|uniref:sugar ABC transporter ATP-binding protein n=1 Tax=uncultured Microbacterium sp. TaxID=191216 RepID=UPI0025DA7574|nr:sugar ABC transporter ATP-binding protein [uncultured Microbacterium sp.]
MPATDAPPLLEVRGASVRFGVESALAGVDFLLRPGEVHSLMGENGAGKSTLIKAITGALRLDSGDILVDGELSRFSSPADAQAAGISTVYQEIDLLPNLTVAENISLGREPRRWGVIDHAAMRERAKDALSALGVDVDPASVLSSHPLAIQQLVAIARAVSIDVKVLVLDEPTSSLDADEVAELFRVIRELKEAGIAVVFVSHFLDQVYEICDRVTVLRGGRLVGEYATRELLRIDLVEKMLGAAAAALAPLGQRMIDDGESASIVSARGIGSGPRLREADLDLAEGEVIGVAGLLGSGRSELARALTGVDRPVTGELLIDGRPVRLNSPRDAIAQRIAYSSENRRTEGIIGNLSVLDNISLALQAQRGIFHRMSTARRRELAHSWVEALHIRPADIDRPVSTLSGGNQQKVLLARLLALSPRVIVLDEPTRGIDVGAKAEIQRLVGELSENGLAIIYISAELDEVLRVAHLVAVMRDGVLAQIVPAAEVTPDALLALVAKPESSEGAADE